MKELAIVERFEDGSFVIHTIIAEGDEQFWKEQFEVAKQAIEFQSTFSELERFNTLHLNLLLSHCIKAGVITKQSVNLEPLLMKVVEKEVAKTSWRLSRRKKLMKQFEVEYQKLSGSFQKSLFSRIGDEAKGWFINFVWNRLPFQFRNFIQTLKQLTK